MSQWVSRGLEYCLCEQLEQRRLLSAGATAHHALPTPAQAHAASSSANKSSSQDSAYLHAVESVMQEFHAPGVAVGISDRKRIVWQAALGKSDVESGAPISLDEHFS